MWYLKKREKKFEEKSQLVVRSPDGAPWAAFPPSVVDPIRRLISRLSRNEQIPARLSFVSALRREGVSYISWAFATTMAHDVETSVCIVDLNWWWPSEFAANFPGSAGLGAVLAGETPLESVVVLTGNPNLAILPAGQIPSEERSYLARSAVLNETLLELNARYDHLILDVPAILASNDAIPLASFGTACCLVIHQGVTAVEEVKSALSDLNHLIHLGVVMNKYHLATPEFILKFINPYSFA